MILKNEVPIVNVYIGEFVSDKVDSNFNATSLVTLSYSDFMAWVYQRCDVIYNGNMLTFVICPLAYELATNDCYETIDKHFGYVMRYID